MYKVKKRETKILSGTNKKYGTGLPPQMRGIPNVIFRFSLFFLSVEEKLSSIFSTEKSSLTWEKRIF